MKAMILAAGRGERLRPLTDHTPKPLLQAGGKRLIEWQIMHLAAAGITEIVINHAYLGDQIVAAVGNGEQFGVHVQYRAEQGAALETGGGIFNALPWLGPEAFVVVNSDVWTDFPYAQLPRVLPGNILAHLVLVDNPPQHPQGDFVLQQGRLVDWSGPRLTFSGIGVYRPELFIGCSAGRFALAPLLRAAIAQGQVSGEHYLGPWFDIGTPQRLAELNTWLSTRAGPAHG